MKCYICAIALHGAKTSTLLKVDQKYVGSSETWCWRGIEIRWRDRVRNEEVLYRVKEGRKFNTHYKGRRLTGLVRSCSETAF
jgi:hypothetical protein